MAKKMIPLESPGIFLKEEFMIPLKLSAYKLAKNTGISNMTISEILRGKRRISPKVGLRLARYFSLSEGYFLRLQTQYDIDRIKESESGELEKIVAFA